MRGGLRVAPEQLEGLVEDLEMLAPVDHDGAQRGMDLAAVGQVDLGQRLQAGDRLARAERQAGAAQQAA